MQVSYEPLLDPTGSSRSRPHIYVLLPAELGSMTATRYLKKIVAATEHNAGCSGGETMAMLKGLTYHVAVKREAYCENR